MQDWKKWLNPFTWMDVFWQTFRAALGSILRFFGIQMPQPQAQHENITPADVNDAYEAAAAAEAQPESFGAEIDSKVNGFFRYVQMPKEERASADLSVFTPEEQDFILGLSETQLDTLRERGSFGALQAILIRRIPEWPRLKTAPEIRPEPSKADRVRDAFLERAIRRRPEEAATAALEFTPLPVR